MPRVCTVCSHTDRGAIYHVLVIGEPFRGLAALYRVSEDAIARHKRDHVPTLLTKAHEAGEVARADDLLGQLRDLQQTTLRLLDSAEKAGDLRTAVAAVGQCRATLALQLAIEARREQAQGSGPERITVREILIERPADSPRLSEAGELRESAGDADLVGRFGWPEVIIDR
ncbi:MAG: hypothetical protein ACR2PL_16405 [Dehalococcoidia bacterium]